jgi:7-carboxy-7-deazaguanine synthase
MLTGKISEIFYSIQGEGIYVGTGHIFIRFFGCNIKCRYCDTNKNEFKQYTVAQLIAQVAKLEKKHKAKYISLTGGEPLLQAAFIKRFLKALNTKAAVYLETNGLLVADFLNIKDQLDIVAMDFKIPSASGLEDFSQEHARFLKAGENKKIFVKAVVGLKTKAREIETAAKLIAKINKNIPLVLQPMHAQLSLALIRKTMLWQTDCQKYLNDVRLIPQIHKLIGVI